MYNIDWNIQFKTGSKTYKLALLAEVEVVSSVDSIADQATIVLPETANNKVLDLEQKIVRGSEVLIQFGYNNELKTEFKGWVREVISNDSSLKIFCEDDIFLFRKSIANKNLKPASMKDVLQYVVDQVDPEFTVNCTYAINYEKFTIYDATGYDVLKRLQEETKFNLDFNREDKVINVYPPYLESTGSVAYSMQDNIENSSLEFKNKFDDKFEVIIESTNLAGKVSKIKRGSTGGDKTTIKVGAMDKESMIELANNILKKKAAPAYEGSFDAWAIPFVKPSMSAQIKDSEYPEKTSFYYVATVSTRMSSSGIRRTITPTLKLN